MNDQITNLPVVGETEVPLVPEVVLDENGNPVVAETEVVGFVQEGEGTVADTVEG